VFFQRIQDQATLVLLDTTVQQSITALLRLQELLDAGDSSVLPVDGLM
jgi:hypothetical protein